MTARTEEPQIDLSAGLRPKKKTVASKVDISAGLVAKVKNAPSQSDSSLDEAPTAQPSQAKAYPALRKTKSRPAPVVEPHREDPATYKQDAGMQADLPSIPEPVPAGYESARPLSQIVA